MTLHSKTDVVNSMITPKDGKGHRSRMLKSGQVGRKKERTATQGERSSHPSHGLAHDYHGGPELAVNSAEDYSQDSFFVTLVRLTSCEQCVTLVHMATQSIQPMTLKAGWKQSRVYLLQNLYKLRLLF